MSLRTASIVGGSSKIETLYRTMLVSTTETNDEF
jgi:hypothetical protein